MSGKHPRIYLSPPHLTGEELRLVSDAFASNWIAPLGPNVDAFEREMCERTGARYALATTSGTAALHLALITAGVTAGDEVLVSDLTFAASVNPILYLGARPVFIDAERTSWNMDPALVRRALEMRAASGRLPRALVLVHLYGQAADIAPIQEACAEYGVALVEDAAEALGATYRGRHPGTFGRSGVFSFNGNKIITTSMGGMLVSADEKLIAHARKLATQARDPVPWYQHSEVGYNYRMSNVLAAIGRAQLAALEDRVAARRAVFARYLYALGDLPGVTFMPEAPWGRHTRWLTTLTIDPANFGATRDDLLAALERHDIEARPFWMPMHLQPAYRDYEVVGGEVGADLFRRGACVPSGSQLTTDQQDRVIDLIRDLARPA